MPFGDIQNIPKGGSNDFDFGGDFGNENENPNL